MEQTTNTTESEEEEVKPFGLLNLQVGSTEINLRGLSQIQLAVAAFYPVSMGAVALLHKCSPRFLSLHSQETMISHPFCEVQTSKHLCCFVFFPMKILPPSSRVDVVFSDSFQPIASLCVFSPFLLDGEVIVSRAHV